MKFCGAQEIIFILCMTSTIIMTSIYTVEVNFDDLPKAVVITPVADIVRKPLQDLSGFETTVQAYQSLGYKELDHSEIGTDKDLYSRAYQLLFNEQVGILREHGDEVLIHVPYIFYHRSRGAIPQSDYWILKDAVMPIEQLEQRGLEINKIPDPLCTTMSNFSDCSKNVVTLALPFKDSDTGLVYSAGTRFVCLNLEYVYASECIAVYIFNPQTFSFKTSMIPSKLCIPYLEKNENERISDFISLLRAWIGLSQGVIPYVWGGSSFTNLMHNNEIWKKRFFSDTADEEDIAIHSTFGSFPHTGFDCSCVIMRAAHICGIPYFFGNSSSLELVLDPLSDYRQLNDGDIIWFPGHVMVISSISKNLLIEVRGYNTGYGLLLETDLSSAFKDITTYEQLFTKAQEGKSLYLLHRDGTVRPPLLGVKFFSLRDASARSSLFSELNDPVG